MTLLLIQLKTWRILQEAMVRSILEFLDHEEEKAKRGL
jgi:hypothetical protein